MEKVNIHRKIVLSDYIQSILPHNIKLSYLAFYQIIGGKQKYIGTINLTKSESTFSVSVLTNLENEVSLSQFLIKIGVEKAQIESFEEQITLVTGLKI